MLLGYKPLPWEANPAYLSQRVHSHAAAHLVRHLLRCACSSTSSVTSSLWPHRLSAVTQRIRQKALFSSTAFGSP